MAKAQRVFKIWMEVEEIITTDDDEIYVQRKEMVTPLKYAGTEEQVIAYMERLSADEFSPIEKEEFEQEITISKKKLKELKDNQ